MEVFGSLSSDLACKGSDVDMTLLLNGYLAYKQTFETMQSFQNNYQESSNHLLTSNKMEFHNEKEDLTNFSDEMSDDNEDLEELNEESALSPSKSTKVLRDSLNVFFNEKNYKKFIEFDIEIQVKILAQILQKDFSEIKKLYTITNTRCPLIRFVHQKLNVNCDLSVNN